MSQALTIIKKATKDSRVALLTGALIGALTGLYPILSAIALALLIALVFSMSVLDQRRALQHVEVTCREIETLLLPNQTALDAVKRANESYLVAGDFVEITSHPNINNAVRIADAGWQPEDILLERLEVPFDASGIIRAAGGIADFYPPNGAKYSVVNTPFVTEESPRLVLKIRDTDYFTIKTSMKYLKTHPVDNALFGSVHLEENKVPSSLCLHYLVLTQDGFILCMRRRPDMAYHGGQISVTGEEQLSTEDLHSNNPITTLFIRALAEEILGLRNSRALHEVVSGVDRLVHFARVISFGMELPLYNPTLIGIAQLTFTKDGLRNYLLQYRVDPRIVNGYDDEGEFFLLDQDEAVRLLREGKGTVNGLFSGVPQLIASGQLHPTSRYRLFRCVRHVLRRQVS